MSSRWEKDDVVCARFAALAAKQVTGAAYIPMSSLVKQITHSTQWVAALSVVGWHPLAPWLVCQTCIIKYYIKYSIIDPSVNFPYGMI